MSAWRTLSRRLLRKKPVTPGGSLTLSRSLNRLDLMVIGVAQIIGAGIFVISGVGIRIAGPGLLHS